MTDRATLSHHCTPAATEGPRTVRTVVGRVPVDAGTVAVGRFDRSVLDVFGPLCWSGPRWAASTSGFGDGTYDVVALERDGRRSGVEVVFVTGSRAVGPHADGPVAGLHRRVFATVDVDGAVDVGDPCHGPAALAVALPAGRYFAYVCVDDELAPGRVARLGLVTTED